MVDEDKEIKMSFLLERYKYVLLRKNDLNEKTFKIVAIYQVILFAVLTGFYSISSNIKDPYLLNVYCKCLILMIMSSTILMIILIISGIFSWLNSREHESEILLAVFGVERKKVRFREVMFWFETYIIIAMFIATSIVCYFYNVFII